MVLGGKQYFMLGPAECGKIRDKLKIAMHIGTADILFCDNEILHLYLDSLNIAHEEIEGLPRVGQNIIVLANNKLTYQSGRSNHITTIKLEC